MSTRVYLSLGSNIRPRPHLRAALEALDRELGELLVSPVYESVSVGFEGDNFLNLVVGLDVELSVGELSGLLRGVEVANGRVRQASKFSSRTLDIDILTYGDTVGVVDGVQLPRDEINRYAFVIQPLADLVPEERDPLTGERYREICVRVRAHDNSIWQIESDWLWP